MIQLVIFINLPNDILFREALDEIFQRVVKWASALKYVSLPADDTTSLNFDVMSQCEFCGNPRQDGKNTKHLL